MAHLLFFRSAPSFVQVGEAQLGDGKAVPVKTYYGQHEIIEMNVNMRRYPLNKGRDGYNIPHSSEWKFMEYRLKKEIIADHVRDLGAVVLNPVPNNVSLWKILHPYRRPVTRKEPNRMNHAEVSIGRLFLFIQYGFKNFYRLCYVISMLFNTTVLLLSLLRDTYKLDIKSIKKSCAKWLAHARNPYHFPIKPVPKSDGPPNKFSKGWSYHYVYGVVNDIDRGYGEEL